ncbi:MAG: hypothetical protein ACRDC7_12205, partial [Aeromonas veronii]
PSRWWSGRWSATRSGSSFSPYSHQQKAQTWFGPFAICLLAQCLPIIRKLNSKRPTEVGRFYLQYRC